jgi:hypothetical protein
MRRLRDASQASSGRQGSPSAPTTWGCLQWLDVVRRRAAKAAWEQSSESAPWGTSLVPCPEVRSRGPKSPPWSAERRAPRSRVSHTRLPCAPNAGVLASQASRLRRDLPSRAFRRSAPSHGGGAGESTPSINHRHTRRLTKTRAGGALAASPRCSGTSRARLAGWGNPMPETAQKIYPIRELARQESR